VAQDCFGHFPIDGTKQPAEAGFIGSRQDVGGALAMGLKLELSQGG
jgi:hypothetical protein